MRKKDFMRLRNWFDVPHIPLYPNLSGIQKKVPRTVLSLFLCAVFLTGCVSPAQDSGNRTLPASASAAGIQGMEEKTTAADSPSVTGRPFKYETDPEVFSLSFLVDDETENGADGGVVPAVMAGPKRTVENYAVDEDVITWEYPDENITVTVKQIEDYLSVALTSDTDEDNVFSWPEIAAKQYYFPFGEGKSVPCDNQIWKEYLGGQKFSVLERLSMPFWAAEAGEYAVLFIMEDPFHTSLNFHENQDIAFSVQHEYPGIVQEKTARYRIYLTENDPVSVAKLYRKYAVETGTLVTLEQKAENNPNIRKLYGAPFIYLWGEQVVSPQDIDWKAFRESIGTPVMDYLADQLEGAAEFKMTLNEINSQDYVAEYQKNVICNYLSQLLKQPDFYRAEVLTESSPKFNRLLQKGYDGLNDADRLQANKQALAANLPRVFRSADQWMEEGTTELVDQLKSSGIDRAWIGLNSWEQAYAKPELTEAAADAGFLIGSYDSYHSIHEPGKEQWITAQFEDDTLYERASVTDKNGEKIAGFQRVGRKLNPAMSLPAVKGRMEHIMSNGLPFNSWFIDCDATGEIYDDYTPEHITTQQQDLKARLERMAYIRDTYGMVIGSEGGHDLAASVIAFAHGIELQSFSWMDEDMKTNKESEYYIGRYYNANGGVAEHFSKRIPVKDRYNTLFADPKYDVPLFKLVYNDSVITSYHWDWSTFKIQDMTKQRMVREILYNVPPLYHLDGEEWKEYREDIVNHTAVWSEFSRKAVNREMTNFEYLTEDGSVQMTEYGPDLRVVANFSNEPILFEEWEIPADSALIGMDGTVFVYTPSVAPEHA